MTRNEELQIKVERLRRFCADNSMHGLMLTSRANFAWITCGGLNYVNRASETGVAAVLVTPDRLVLLADNIEMQRLVEEELGEELADAFDTAEFDWYDPDDRRRTVETMIGGRSVGCDTPQGPGQRIAPKTMGDLRVPLTDAEVDRYVALGRLAGAQTEAICRRIEKGMTGHEVEAMTLQAFAEAGVRVPVCLVAADQRLLTRRHPIPKPQPIEHRAMLVVCAEQAGLWVNLTRLVSLSPVEGDMKIKHRAVCQVDATANAATQPGRTFADVFADIIAEYEKQGFAEQWQLHHQGGSTGYNGRDVFANPACESVVQAGQAFAWNPSITGTKSEDTMLLTEQGLRWITEPGPDWPTLQIERDGQAFRRADILELG